MTIEQILEIIERYKLRIPPTVYYELLADLQELEEEQEPCDKYIKEIDHLRKYIYNLETQIVEQEPVIDKIRAEVENINVWGMRYNPDTDKDRKPQIVQKVKEHVIEILDKYKAETEDKA